MKNIQLILFIALLISFYPSCNLEEHPNFLNSENIFEDVNGANIALNGVYNALQGYGYLGSEYHSILNWSSGMYNSNRKASLKTTASLKPSPNDKFLTNFWGGVYTTISRANSMISQLEQKDLGDPKARDYILGEVLFLRAFSYFDLARVFGRAPLITEVITPDNSNNPLASNAELFEQIISDAVRATELMVPSGENKPGRPSVDAAHMLLAKVYMWLAGNKTSGETDMWTKAYDEAIQVKDHYQLMPNFGDLWADATRDNNIEAIFEVQGNVEQPFKLIRYWSASSSNKGRSTWGRFKPNLEVYDRHVSTYPTDPRINYSFKSKYTKFKPNGSTQEIKAYPFFNKRNSKDKSYPYGYKYFVKDNTIINTDANINFVVYRYAELLLMLAEIENELNGPDNAYQYVNEVLERARNSSDSTAVDPANWSAMDQETFRDKIYKEYFFELQQEGKDFFYVRRRGFDFFKEFVIDAHNNNPKYDFSIETDVKLDERDRIMVLPIPQSEIISNAQISDSDQNPGY